MNINRENLSLPTPQGTPNYPFWRAKPMNLIRLYTIHRNAEHSHG